MENKFKEHVAKKKLSSSIPWNCHDAVTWGKFNYGWNLLLVTHI